MIHGDRRQRGWLMPVAAFIIVVMGLLAAGMVRVGSQTSIAGAQEQITVQTFYAADSGAQFAMNRLLYATDADRAAADSACMALGGGPPTLNLNTAGMRNCTVTVSCDVNVFASGGNTTSFYDIRSTARCGVNSVRAERTIEVSAYLQ